MTAAKEELADCQIEFAQLREDLLDSVRATHKEIKLANFIIEYCIPGEHLFVHSSELSNCLQTVHALSSPTLSLSLSPFVIHHQSNFTK